MNENPEGTPNPLNNTPEAAPAAPATPAPAEPVAEPVAPVAAAPVAEAAKPVAPVAAASVAEPQVATPAKKKKGGLIAGIICLVVALGCGIAALLVLFVFNKGGDPVTDGLVKLLNGDKRNIAVNGTADLDMLGNSFNIDYNAQFDTVAQAGSFGANIAFDYNGVDATLSAEGRKIGGGDAYLKISGLKDLFLGSLTQYGIDCTAVDCEQYLSMMSTSTSAANQSSLLSIEDKWVRVATNDSFSNFPVSLPGGVDLGDLGSEKNTIIDLYKKYPFLISSTDNLGIAKKNDTLYKITYDYDKMASFMNELSKNAKCDEGASCATKDVTADELKAQLSDSGEYYVEVNGDHDITRIYVKSGTEGGFDTTVDMAISYPSSINIEAPTDFIESSDAFTLFNMFGAFNQGGSSYNSYDDDYDWGYDDEDYDYSESYDWSWSTD